MNSSKTIERTWDKAAFACSYVQRDAPRRSGRSSRAISLWLSSITAICVPNMARTKFEPVRRMGEQQMTLKIQRSVEWQSVVVFTLAGRIRAEQVSEIQALVTPELTNCCVVLDLRRRQAAW